MKKYKVSMEKIGEIEITEKNIKKCYLRVYPHGKVAVSVPKNYGIGGAMKFITSNLAWIEQRLQKAHTPDSAVYYLGNKVALTDYSIESVNKYFASKKKQAYALYKSILSGYLAKYPEFYPPPALKVRSMVSWGLYNKAKNLITLNLKLIQADIESIKMVVFHELCHMVEQNHSARFYALLAREFPHYKDIRKSMKKYSTRF